jgi:hypothetical protein
VVIAEFQQHSMKRKFYFSLAPLISAATTAGLSDLTRNKSSPRYFTEGGAILRDLVSAIVVESEYRFSLHKKPLPLLVAVIYRNDPNY